MIRLERIRRAAVVLAVAMLAMGVARAEEKKTEKSTEKGKSNRDLYLANSGGENSPDAPTPASVQPTVKFWAERGNKSRDIVLDDKNTVYRSGDTVWFKFAANVNCYAYLVNKGSSGKVHMLYPGLAGRDNKVRAYQIKVMPSQGIPFRFDENPGDEKLCLVISPGRIPDFESPEEGGEEGGRSIELDKEKQKAWDKALERAAVMGRTRDLTLEQAPETEAGEGPGNYATDHGGTGFTRPIAITVTLRHEP